MNCTESFSLYDYQRNGILYSGSQAVPEQLRSDIRIEENAEIREKMRKTTRVGGFQIGQLRTNGLKFRVKQMLASNQRMKPAYFSSARI